MAIGSPTSVMSPRPVTTQVPALRIAENACATCSGLVTPTVTIAESAPWPLVNCLASSVASSMDSNGVRGAQLLRLLPLERHRVHRDDVGRAGVRRALHGVDADAADAHDDHRVAGLHLGRVDRRAPAGAHPAADQAGHLQRDVVGHLHRGVGGHRGGLAERGDAAHLPDRLAAVGQLQPEVGRVAPARALQQRRRPGRRGSACPRRTSGSARRRAGRRRRRGRPP